MAGAARNSSRVNMAEIARRAGVSMATASRALSNHPHVAESTRLRVRAVADELSYVVSPEASRLSSGTTGRVALVVPHISRWFFAAVLEGIESVLRDADLDVLLYHVGDAEDRRKFFERLPTRRKVDAVVLLGMPVDETEQKRLELLDVEIVAAGGQTATYPYVCIDDEAAGRQAVDHLLYLGHRRIGMIAAIDVDEPGWPLGAPRAEAYFNALNEAGIDVDEQLVVTVPWGGEHGASAMERLLSMRRPPTAVYAHSDEVALGALRTLRRAGLRVPDDMSVIGMDDHPLAELTDLSTVAQRPLDQGVIAARMLLDRLRGKSVEEGTFVPTQLVIRSSTGPPRG